MSTLDVLEDLEAQTGHQPKGKEKDPGETSSSPQPIGELTLGQAAHKVRDRIFELKRMANGNYDRERELLETDRVLQALKANADRLKPQSMTSF